MKLHLKRFIQEEEYSYGLLYINGCIECFMMGDGKIIPVGEYEIKFREIQSPLTQKYQDKFDWFLYHLEIQNIPNRRYVYIHIGNDGKDTDACLLTGYTCDMTAGANGFIGKSTLSFKRLYKKVYKALIGKEKVTIKIEDEKTNF